MHSRALPRSFGGESYRPYMYHNAVNRLMLPPAVAAQMRAEASTPVSR